MVWGKGGKLTVDSGHWTVAFQLTIDNGQLTIIGASNVVFCVRPLKSVGNGLCAVPLRGNYNPCRQPEPPTDMSFRAKRSESRNLPELHVLSCGGSSSNVVDFSTPLVLKA